MFGMVRKAHLKLSLCLYYIPNITLVVLVVVRIVCWGCPGQRSSRRNNPPRCIRCPLAVSQKNFYFTLQFLFVSVTSTRKDIFIKMTLRAWVIPRQAIIIFCTTDNMYNMYNWLMNVDIISMKALDELLLMPYGWLEELSSSSLNFF